MANENNINKDERELTPRQLLEQIVAETNEAFRRDGTLMDRPSALQQHLGAHLDNTLLIYSPKSRKKGKNKK